MKKYFFAAVLTALMIPLLYAGNVSTSSYLLINDFPEFAAKGGAAGAAFYGISAAGSNPAAIGAMENVEFAVMHNQWHQDVMSEQLNAGKAFDFGNLALGLGYINMGSVAVLKADEFGYPVMTGDISSMRAWDVSLIYGKKIKNFSLGFAARLVSENLSAGDYYTGCADAGFIYEGFLDDNINLGVSLLNISAGDNGYYSPIDLKTAVVYKYVHGGSTVLDLSAGLDCLVKDSYLNAQAGFDYYLLESFILRGGVNINNSGDVSFSAGAGIKLEGMTVNYSYEPGPELGDVHKISVNAAFGKAAGSSEGEGEGEAINDKGSFASYMDSGNFSYENKEYRKALKYYEYINSIYWKDIEGKPDKEKSAFYQKLGICYYNIRDNERAIQYFNRALYFDKDNEILKHWIMLIK